jgi:hypothetical protein
VKSARIGIQVRGEQDERAALIFNASRRIVSAILHMPHLTASVQFEALRFNPDFIDATAHLTMGEASEVRFQSRP